MDVPQDPAKPLLGIYPKDTSSYYKDTCSTMFITALLVIARNWKQPKYPSTKKMDKERKCGTFMQWIIY